MSSMMNVHWYHNKISRIEAENLLKSNETGKGTFLVRESNSSVGDYVLSVLHSNDEVIHYQIRKHGDDAFFSIDEELIIHGLDSLVEYYQQLHEQQQQEQHQQINNHINNNNINKIEPELKYPIQGNPPPYYTRRHGQTTLFHRATERSGYNVVREMLNCGYPCIDAKNHDGQTAAHIASRKGDNDILKELIENGANINCIDAAGCTPLHYACQSNLINTVKLLILEGNANVQIRNHDTDWVALHEAASRGYYNIIQTLLALNTPARPRTNQNQTPEDLALLNKHYACAKLLREYKQANAKTNKLDWYHGTLDRNESNNIFIKYGIKQKQQQQYKDTNNYIKDGTYLVRYSEHNNNNNNNTINNNNSINGNYVLTMMVQNKTYHYIIGRKDSFYYIDQGPYFESLEHVIEYYSQFSDGLYCKLQYPIKPEPKPPLPEFSTIPRIDRLTFRGPLTTITSTTTTVKQQQQDDNKDQEQIININNKSNNSSSTSSSSSSNNSNNNNINNNNKLVNDNTNDDNNDITMLQLYDDIIISKDQLKLEHIIGSGEFGLVYKGIYNNNISVAIKTLNNNNITTITTTTTTNNNNNNDRDSFIREAKVMYKLKHHCIVKLIGLCYDSTKNILMMIQEYVEYGSLLNYMKQQQQEEEQEEYKQLLQYNTQLYIWCAQITCGMIYLEQEQYVHRDLAARNILVASRNQVKISDFGLSRALNVNSDYYKASNGGKWPVRWYAPESYNYGTFTHKSDVWSFGILLWEMFTFGEQPYGDIKGVEVIKLIDNGERLSKPIHCPDKIYNIMLDCWQHDPLKRPTFKQLFDFFATEPGYMNLQELIHNDDIS